MLGQGGAELVSGPHDEEPTTANAIVLSLGLDVAAGGLPAATALVSDEADDSTAVNAQEDEFPIVIPLVPRAPEVVERAALLALPLTATTSRASAAHPTTSPAACPRSLPGPVRNSDQAGVKRQSAANAIKGKYRDLVLIPAA